MKEAKGDEALWCLGRSSLIFQKKDLDRMSIGALIDRNTVVLKPASDTPIIGYLFTEIMKKARLPSGILNFITGSGDIIGKL